MKGFELQFEDNEYYLVDGKTNDTIATTDKVLLKEYDGYMKKLSLKNCEAIERGYDLFELSEKEAKKIHDWNKHKYSEVFYNKLVRKDAEFIKIGFLKALEILGDNKFSEEDMINFAEYCKGDLMKTKDLFNEYQSIKQTEWYVEICCYIGNGDKESDIFNDPLVTNTGIPKLDENGCIILKRK